MLCAVFAVEGFSPARTFLLKSGGLLVGMPSADTLGPGVRSDATILGASGSEGYPVGIGEAELPTKSGRVPQIDSRVAGHGHHINRPQQPGCVAHSAQSLQAALQLRL